MYPPAPTKSLEELLSNLVGFLQRAGDREFTGECKWGECEVDKHCKGYRIALQLRRVIPLAQRPLVAELIKGYITTSGWKPVKIVHHRFWIELCVVNS